MKTEQTAILFLIFISSFISSLQAQSQEIYVISSQYSNERDFSYPNGTKANPYISLGTALYEAQEGISYVIYISPDKHQVQCLFCENCPHSCEILRGGKIAQGTKNIKIKAYNCNEDTQDELLCKSQAKDSILQISNQSIQIKLKHDSLTIENVILSGDQMLDFCQQEECNELDDSLFIVSYSILELTNSSVEDFKEVKQHFFNIENSQVDLYNITISIVHLKLKGYFLRANNSYVSIQNSQFQNNQGDLVLSDQSEFQVINTQFKSNKVEQKLMHLSSSQLLLQNSLIEECQNQEILQFIQQNENSNKIINQSNTTNEIKGGGTIISQNSEINIQSCAFNRNTAWHGGAITLIRSKCNYISNSTFQENQALDQGGSIYLINSNIDKIQQSTFRQNKAFYSGGAVYLYNSTISSIMSSYFQNNICKQENGGAFNLLNSIISSIENVEASANSVFQGSGGFLFSQNSRINYIKNNQLFQNSAKQNGGLFSFTSNSNVEYLDNNTINDNQAQFGGSIQIESSEISIIQNNNFNSNQALNSGGSAYFKNSIIQKIENSYFFQNQALLNGGALFILDTIIQEIRNISAIGNVAQSENGGFLYAQNLNISQIVDSQLQDNQASKNGGALFILDTSIQEIRNISAKGNAAQSENGGFINAQNS